MDIIHRPVFYLKLNSTLYVCPYHTGSTLCLRYEPNRLMLSIGLCCWYINITITILDIIHRPVFYLRLNSTLQVRPYLMGNTLRLSYQPNTLMLSIGLWRWYINITITILDIIHRPVTNLTLTSTLYDWPYLTRNTLRLRYEPNRLMLPIGLWRLHININITILDIIHRLVFNFKLNPTLNVWPCLTGNTLRLRYETIRLMISIGLWWWHINITITVLDSIHRPIFYWKLISTL
jgi:hypothetical protein